MGTWSVSVTGNDTAQDLKSEYQAAFFYNDPETAVKKIDSYVRKNICDESDEEEWCNYYYSLADYMWKKGILPDGICQRALSMIDSGFGLGAWLEAGEKTLKARKEALGKFRLQLKTEQPKKKKITVSLYTEPVFKTGDVIAMQLQTKNKPYASNAIKQKNITEEEFHSFDGKFVLIRKVSDHISWTSAIEPNVKDIWPVFQLFDGIYDEIPEEISISGLKNAKFRGHKFVTPVFLTDGGKGRYKKRKCRVIVNDPAGIDGLKKETPVSVFLSVNNDCSNPDSMFVSAMGESF